MCHILLIRVLVGESCREQESPEEVERVVERQTEEVDVSLLACSY